MTERNNWGGAVATRPAPFTEFANQNNQALSTSAVNATPYDAANSGNNKLEQLKKFFGVPAQPVHSDPYDDYHVENLDLPDAYKGNNNYIRRILISKVEEQDEYPYKVLAPITREEASMEIVWDLWKFDDHMMGRTPEESVSRLLSSTFSSQRDYMVRYGLAMILEHGFWKTPMGQKAYVMALQQISNACSDTLAHQAMVQLLNCRPYEDPNSKFRQNQQKNMLQLEQFFRNEIDNWAVVQKTEDGWEIIIDQLRQTMASRGRERGDRTVVPSGMMKYTKHRPEERYYYLSGKTNDPDSRTLVGDGLHESRAFRQGHDQPSVDPCYQERTIGGFFQLTDAHLKHVPLADYTTSMMDTYIYNENSDDYHRIQYRDAVYYMGLYDWSDEPNLPLTQLGQTFFNGVDTWGKVLQCCNQLDRAARKISMLPDASKRQFLDYFNGGSSSGSSSNQQSYSPPQSDDDETEDDEPINQKFQTQPKPTKVTQKKIQSKPAALAVDSVYPHTKLSYTPDRQNANAQHLTALGAHPAIASQKEAKTFFKAIRSEFNGNGSAGPLTGPLAVAELTDSEVQYSGHLWDMIISTAYSSAKAAGVPSPYVSYGQALAVADIGSVANPPLTLPASIQNIDWKNAIGGGAGFLADAINYSATRIARETASKPDKQIGGLSANDAFVDVDEIQSWSHLSVDDAAYVSKTQANSLFKGMTPNAYLQDTRKQREEVLRAVLPSHTAGLTKIYVTINESFDLDALLNNAALQQSGSTRQYSALDYTLAANHTILFDVSDRSSGAVSHYQTVPTATNDDMRALNSRWARVQFSYSVSRVFTELYNSKNQPDVAALIPKLRQCFPEDAAFASWAAELKAIDDIRTALPAAGIQSLIRPIVDQCIKITVDLINAIKDNKALDAAVVSAATIDYAAAELAYAKQELLQHSVVSRVAAEASTEKLIQWHPHMPLGALIHASVTEPTDYRKFYDAADAYRARAHKVIDAVVKRTVDAPENVLDGMQFYRGTLAAVWATAQIRNKDAPNRTLTEKILAKLVKLGGLVAAQRPDCISAFTAAVNHVYGFAVQETDPQETAAYEALAKQMESDDTYSDKPKFNAFIQTIYNQFSIIHTETTSTVYEYRRPQPKKPGQLTRHARAGKSVATPASLSADEIKEILMNAVYVDSGLFWKWSIDNDIPVAITGIGFRPHKRYDMGTILYMTGGGSAAKTFFGHADFQLADNVAQKMHFGHFTMYAKTVVLDNSKIVHGYNAYCRGYNGGNGVSFYNSLNPDHVAEYKQGETNHDIFMAATLAHHLINTSALDITGEFQASLNPSLEANESTNYFNCESLARLWGWTSRYNPLTVQHVNQAIGRYNTVTFQEHQLQYEYKGTGQGGFTKVIVDKVSETNIVCLMIPFANIMLYCFDIAGSLGSSGVSVCYHFVAQCILYQFSNSIVLFMYVQWMWCCETWGS